VRMLALICWSFYGVGLDVWVIGHGVVDFWYG